MAPSFSTVELYLRARRRRRLRTFAIVVVSMVVGGVAATLAAKYAVTAAFLYLLTQ